MPSLIVYILLFVFCLMVSAYFSASETAFMSLQRVRLEHMVQKNVKSARRVARLIEKPEKFLSTVLLGNNFVNTAAAALGTLVAVRLWGERGVVYATLAVTAVLLVFGETTPKTIAIQHAERLALANARSIDALSWLFTPFVIVLSWIASIFARIVGGKPLPRSLAGPEEIRAMITFGRKEGSLGDGEANMLHNVFDFGERPARDVMVPRPEVVWLEKGATLTEFLTLYTQFPFSRFPVFHDNRDNVVGTLSVKDVLMSLAETSLDRQSPIDSLIRPAYFVPETKRISELFTEMQAKNYHLAVIVDEYGGTAGIVTLSALIEEIVGPIKDEMAILGKEYEVIDEHTFQVDGAMRIEDANAEMDLRLPEGDYETLAGFVLHLLGHIPKVNDQLKYRGLKLVITEMRGRKIEKILLTKEKPPTPITEPAPNKLEAKPD